MKRYYQFLIFILPLFFTSCIVVDNTPGPHGRDGNAYFGIDYEHRPPYSYWDDNKSIPYDPALGEYYHIYPGIYEFEYFINEHEYWYGTYEVWINHGGVGGHHGEPGYDGMDTFLMLITDPNGFHEHRNEYRVDETQPLVIEVKEEGRSYKITIQKGSTTTRAAQEPKFKRE